MPNSTDEGDSWRPDWWDAAAAVFGALTAFTGLNYSEVGRALGMIVDSPVAFVREYILEGLLIILVETIIQGFFGLLAQVGAELRLVADQLWNATFGTLIELGTSLVTGVIEPLVFGLQSAMLVGLAGLGIAAPFAAAISIFVTGLVVLASVTIVFELLRWAVPVDAITEPVNSVLSGARASMTRLPFVGGSGGDR